MADENIAATADVADPFDQKDPGGWSLRGDLLDCLREVQASFDETGADRLLACIAGLDALRMALNTNPLVGAEGLTGWLGKLTLALADCHAGAKPELLESRSPPSRPTRPSLDMLKASSAHVLDTMTEGGMPQEEAARFIASLLRKNGVEEVAGKGVSTKLIISWRRGIKECTASDSAQRVYRRLADERSKHVGAGHHTDPRGEARALLTKMLRFYN
jgi:hypothetical protein